MENVNDEHVIELVGTDGGVEFPRYSIDHTNMIKNMLEDMEVINNTDKTTKIIIPNTEKEVLERMKKYAIAYHNNLPKDTKKDAKQKPEISFEDWELEHKTTDIPTLQKMIQACNFMEFKKMLTFSVFCMAELVKGKTTEQLREMFNIENDFTPEEEEQIKKESKWCTECS